MADDIAGSQQVAWVFETMIHAGQWPAVELLTKEAIEATGADPKALNYEFFGDGAVLHVFEKYADSPVTLAHLAWFGENIPSAFCPWPTSHGSPCTGRRVTTSVRCSTRWAPHM